MFKPLLVSLGLSVIASPLLAQADGSLIRGPAPSVLFLQRTTGVHLAAATDSTEKVIRPTHWKRGLLIGGGIGAVGVGVLTYGLCQSSETQESCLGITLGGAAVGAVVGGVIGALIGGQVPKQADSPAPADSTSTAP